MVARYPIGRLEITFIHLVLLHHHGRIGEKIVWFLLVCCCLMQDMGPFSSVAGPGVWLWTRVRQYPACQALRLLLFSVHVLTLLYVDAAKQYQGEHIPWPNLG